nr:hypothetical protein Iba_chr03dCG1590 [Ipomoea batatas]GME15197.1 hypothetical protein Iba_scaffold15946CG0610 [Ipomoea batatas]
MCAYVVPGRNVSNSIKCCEVTSFHISFLGCFSSLLPLLFRWISQAVQFV